MVRQIATFSCLAAALALTACSPSDDSATRVTGATGETQIAPAQRAEVTHPESGLKVIDVTVDTGKKRIVFRAELADTEEAQAKGLMFRTEMADDEAMIFPSAAPETRSFWMRNTPLPLDIIFIGPDGTITNIEEGIPYSTKSVSSDGPSIAVLEVHGGLSEMIGIAPGDGVEFRLR